MFAKLAVSVAVGFLGAYPLASSSGLMGLPWTGNSSPSVVFSSGIILSMLSLALIGPILRLTRQVVETLGRVEERPRPAIAFTMLGLGTVCAISSLMIQRDAGNQQPASLSMNLPGFNAPPSVAVQASGSLALGFLTILTFLLGASLIGLGTWASLKSSAKVPAAFLKPEAPELAEVAG